MPVGAPPLLPSGDHHHVAPSEAWRGLRGGLMPLAVVVVCVAATVGLTVVARHLLAGSGFFAEQRACVIVSSAPGCTSVCGHHRFRAACPCAGRRLPGRTSIPTTLAAVHAPGRVRLTRACVCAQRCSSRSRVPHPSRVRCPARVVALHTDMTVRTTEVWGTTIEFRARMIYLVRKGLRRLQEA
jgi:hypothetical protein